MKLVESMRQVLLDNFNVHQLKCLMWISGLLSFIVWMHLFGVFTCGECMMVIGPIVNLMLVVWIWKSRRYWGS